MVINLTWPEDDESLRRVQELRVLGFEASLTKALHVTEPSIDLQDRVSIALEHFTMSHG